MFRIGDKCSGYERNVQDRREMFRIGEKCSG